MKAIVVIPAFNESAVIASVLKSIPKKIPGIDSIQIIVVDDGSQDNTAQIVAKAKTGVIRHLLNRGVGAATKTGIEYAKNKADIIVTFDADGQHNPKDIEKVIAPITVKKADLVIGSRLLNFQKMPLDRLLINWLANIVTFFLFGVFSTDSQSGLRAFSKKAVSLINFKGERMDFSSEILLEAKRHNLRVKEVPTTAIYTDYSRGKGQKNVNALPTLARLLIKLFR